MGSSNTANIVNSCICIGFLIFGLFYPSQYVQLYYVTFLELFIKLELFVFIMSVFMMLFGKLCGAHIQINKELDIQKLNSKLFQNIYISYKTDSNQNFPEYCYCDIKDRNKWMISLDTS